MKAWIVCAAMLLCSSAAIAQSQDYPPPNGQDRRDNAPPPNGQDPRGNAPPPDYQDQQGNVPPDYQDQQGDGPPQGYQGGTDNGPPPGYQDQQDDQDQRDDRQDNIPPGANGRYVQPDGRAANPGQRNDGDRVTADGLAGWVLVTSDQNWQAKWETASNTSPTFTTARNVARGKKVFVLIFLANPQLDRAGKANVTCDIEITRPNGSVSTRQAGAVCFSGALQGDPHDTYLSAPVIGFVGDPGDPAGSWRVKVTLNDNNRRISVPLQASFNLLQK